jgi:hypothetical protein
LELLGTDSGQPKRADFKKAYGNCKSNPTKMVVLKNIFFIQMHYRGEQGWMGQKKNKITPSVTSYIFLNI